MILILNNLTGDNYVCIKHFAVTINCLVVACGKVLSFWRTFPKCLWSLDIESTNLLKELIASIILDRAMHNLHFLQLYISHNLWLYVGTNKAVLRYHLSKIPQVLMRKRLPRTLEFWFRFENFFLPNTALCAEGQKIIIGWCKVVWISQAG